MHLSLDHYLLALRGELPLATLEALAHRHLMESCRTCTSEWREAVAAEVGPFVGSVPPREPPSDERLLRLADVEAQARRLTERRKAAREAREDLRRLLRLPAVEWERRVAGARTRFRSRAFGQLLIEACRERVRSAPREAATLAGLVPAALAWAERVERPWVVPLFARAAAHRANALRVAGDLLAAEAIFAGLRGPTGPRAIGDPRVAAEVDSLEASLCIDNRRFQHAEALLSASRRAYARAGDKEGEGRTLIKLANLVHALGRPDEALPMFEEAAAKFASRRGSYEYMCTVTGRVNVLCETERPRQAAELLDDHADFYGRRDRCYESALFRCLQGRVLLGLGENDRAESAFIDGRQQLLDLGRGYDAILASLDLADTLLAAGRLGELKRLAADLVPLFRSRGVERESLASLRLVSEAVRAERLTAELLTELRRSLERR